MPTSPKQISSNALPKYQRIADEIRRQVQTGELQPGDRLPSLAEMRVAHGVTPTTVERVYSVLREDGLIVREQGRGTFVAQPTTRPTTATIGVAGVTFDMQRYPYWVELMEGICSEATKAEYEILLLGETSTIRWEKVDGVLSCGGIGMEAQHRFPPGMPHVVTLAQVEGATCVLADEAQGVRQAVRHLIELGHRRIGHIVSHWSRSRLAVYRDALEEGGITPREEWARKMPKETVPNVDFRQCASDLVREWLDETQGNLGVTALLTQNDEAAVGTIEALRENGVRVPDDISVIGFDGTVAGDYFSPRLTSVRMPLKSIGATATRLLFDAINNATPSPTTMILPTSLKPGHSTAAPVGIEPDNKKSPRS